jgi:hypothetical protein
MICPVCGKNVRVRIDGKLSKHRNPQPEKYWSYYCPGSGKNPLPVETKDTEDDVFVKGAKIP